MRYTIWLGVIQYISITSETEPDSTVIWFFIVGLILCFLQDLAEIVKGK